MSISSDADSSLRDALDSLHDVHHGITMLASRDVLNARHDIAQLVDDCSVLLNLLGEIESYSDLIRTALADYREPRTPDDPE